MIMTEREAMTFLLACNCDKDEFFKFKCQSHNEAIDFVRLAGAPVYKEHLTEEGELIRWYSATNGTTEAVAFLK
ncbi:hypothetical protein [Listeria fleischmannii]|uniref:Uncharacterized protein n=1 Tax=Listeria fleischmannii FSL S10-1203 TaxID=1265822 RepID=W7DUP2_9LIST|nr:hypothetical protein [Listeria fleischmannii]EUJ59179.1 hypothetical protein MCOL2_05890 [Listeria fleischmannii FSL S10-1203]